MTILRLFLIQVLSWGLALINGNFHATPLNSGTPAPLLSTGKQSLN